MKRKINSSDMPSSSEEKNSKLVGYSIIISAVLVYAILGYAIFAIYNHIFNDPGRSANSSLSSSDVSVSPAKTPSVPFFELPVSSRAPELAPALGALADKQEQSKVINTDGRFITYADKKVINTKTVLRMPACPSHTHRDAPRGKCIPNKPTCRPGTHWNEPRGECIPNKPACPLLTHWNEPRGECVPTLLPDCLLGEHYNLRLERCEPNR